VAPNASDGSVVLTNTLISAVSATYGQPWHGVGFGGGGWFEAVLSFDPANPETTAGCGTTYTCWPAWWAWSLEALVHSSGATPGAAPSDAWGVGGAGTRYAELDFFEFFSSHQHEFVGTVHDWANPGGPGASQVDNLQQVYVANATVDYTQPHAYAVLWVPAQPGTGTGGYVQYYFDGAAVGGRVTWAPYHCASPPNTTAPAYGVLDCQHLVLQVDTGPGQPVRLASVEVWQQPGTGANLWA
jgi:hypothetical protein